MEKKRKLIFDVGLRNLQWGWADASKAIEKQRVWLKPYHEHIEWLFGLECRVQLDRCPEVELQL